MRCQLRSLLAALLALSSVGCAVSHTKTNQDASYHEHPTRIYIVGNLDPTGEGVTEEFYRIFEQSVTACGGHTQLYKPRMAAQSDSLTLDNASADADQRKALESVSAFSPDVVLSLHVSNLGLADFGQKTTAVVNEKLWDFKLRKNV